MSNRDIERLKNELLTNKIELSDTISQFMEKCNNNFSAIIEWGGGPAGEKGDEGEPGIPTKPKVPIHIWRKGIEYDSEIIDNDTFTICYSVDLTDSKYQEGHLIMLKNAHVYVLETNSEFKLTPKYIFTLQSYDPSTTINGENAYMHIAYANSPDGDGFVTDQELRNENVEVEPAMTYNLRRNGNGNNSSTNKIYMGVYSDNDPTSSQNPSSYTWVKIQGDAGANGEKGEKGDKGDPGEQGPKGDKGDGYTGQPYTIDLEGDMSTISIDVDRTRLYDDSNDYCMCKLHAYYGDQNVLLDVSNVTVNLPEEFEYSDDNCVDIVLKSNSSSKVGKIEKSQNGKDVIIKFTPDVSFVFPTNPIIFSFHIESEITDDDESKYNFTRDTVWMVKGIVSTFELEIIPKHRSIKLSEDGTYNPEKLLVDVYKNEDGKRTLFDFNQYKTFTLLYKNYNDNDWIKYPNEGVETSGVSCLEFKVVRYLGTSDEETWDYEDVWVVADGKSTHYYHADLGAMESMMVLTTGERINISENTDTPIYCAKLRDESGYSITFEPKLYDGETELTVESISVGSNSGEEYYTNGSFERKIEEYTLTITKVPYDVEMIPMNIIVSGVDSFGVTKQDTVSFNIYISNLSNIYTLSPTVSVYNTSTGTDGVDKIGCNVYKNNILVETDELNSYALTLEYIVCGEQGNTNKKNYTKPIVYGYDTSGNNDNFTASDVAIEFILSYRNKEVAMATVPLIKDGQNGKDGENGQPGENGKDGALYKTIMIYTSTTDDTKPDTPTGGSYNFIDGKFEIDDEKWSNLTDNLEGIIWSSSKTFCNDITYPEDTWTKPIRITGDKGEAGKDGSDIQFIYYRIDSEENKPGKPDNTQTNENPTGGWTSSPTGVDINNQYEYMSMRTKVNDKWSEWSLPALWSKYGVNGQDGDGVEYIYYLETTNNDGTEISKPTYDNSDNKEWHDMSSLYQQKEWVPEGWEDSPTGVSLDHHYEWVSIRKFRYDDTYKRRMWSEFSTPTIWAKFGMNGEKGAPGDGAISKIVMLYATFNETTDITKPLDNIKWDFSQKKVINLESNDVWKTSDNNLTPPVYMSSRIFSDNESLIDETWSYPVKISGKDGEKGVDGDGIEFMYLTNTTIDIPEDKNPKDDDTNESLKTKGWTDNPTGVKEECKFEFMTMRTSIGGVWGNWCEPALWSKYGDTGQDGDGVEYMFTRTENDTAPDNPTPKKSESEDEYDLNANNYQKSEWKPDDTWTDDPKGVDEINRYEWVSMRKYYADETGIKSWHEFSDPSLWGKYVENGKDGAHSKVMMIYTSNDGTTPDTPTGGSYNFTDGSFNCPSGWNTNDTNLSGIVWVSSTVFESNGNQEEQKWSSPVRLTGADGQAGKDGADIDFAYCSTSTTNNIYPPIDMEEDSDSNDTYYDEFGHYTGGYEYTNEENNITYKWTNNPSGVDETNRYEFMSMRTKVNGEWSGWSTPTLWSNYGVNGQDGDGVEYVYTTTDSENDTPTISTPDNWSEVGSDYQKSEFKPTNDEGESIWSDNPSGVKDEDGCRVEWVSSRKYCVSQNDDVKKWQKFSEPKVWSRFSKDGEDGKDGKDGNSWQYIFCVSPKYPFSETGFSNPNGWTDDKPKDSNNELLGDNGQKDPNWFDEHKDVDAVNKFQYQAYRKWDRDNGCWGKYGNPTLYSNYSESGSGYSVMLSNPIAVIPVGDDDWSTNENASNQTDSTFVYFYNNTSDMSTSENLTISLPQYNPYVSRGIFTTTIENNVNKVVFKPVVGNYIFNFGSNTQYKLPITLTYDLGNSDGDKFTTTINWTLSPIKGLSDVEVYVDKRIVNISENTTQSIKVGYYLKSSDGTKTFVENKTSNNKGYKIFLTNDIDELNNEVNNWTNAEYTFVYDDGSNKNCYVVLTDSNGNKLDYVNVTSIKDGQDGISTFISTIFKISKGTPNKPVGGTYDNPVADSTGWSESIPERDNTNHTYPLWSSSKQFASDGSLNKNDWSTPIQMSDTFDFEVIYSNYENPNDPTIDDFSKSRNGEINKKWKDSNPQWSDDGNTGSIWMATTKMNNGTWSNWVISKIKGEQGPKGEQGENGKLGKVTYPDGLYNENKLYILDEVKTPYVICSDENYYMLKSIPDNKKYWAESRKYYNSGHNTTGKDVYKYISVVPDDYNTSTRTSIKNYEQVIGCNNDNFNDKWDENKPPLDKVIASLTGTYKYIGQSYKYENKSQIIGNVIWTLNPDKTEVILASKFLYSKDGTPENIIEDINDVYFSGKSPIDDNENWEIFESFEAIHAKIGIIDNGTIGSAVYSGDYMFSQQGVDSNENTSTSYHNFNPSHIYDSESTFKPNICMNFKTGEMNACCGNVKFGNNSLYVKNFLKKMRTTIDDDNLDNYTETRYFLDEDGNPDNSLPYKVLNIEKTGSFIEWNCSTPETLYLFSLPQLFPGKYGNGIVWEEIDAVRDYIGNEIYIKVNKGSFGIVCYKRINNATNITEKSIMLFEGESAVLTCKPGLITDNNISYECIYWDIIFGKQFEFYYVNHPWEP